MAMKKAHEVEAWLARPDARTHLVLVYGPDRGLVSETARRYAAATGLPMDDPFTVVRMDAASVDADPGRLLDEAMTVAMFAARRLVWVTGSDGGKAIAEAAARLIEAPPVDVSVLIEAGDLKKGAPLRAAVESGDGAMALPCYADDARALDRLIDTELARENLTIDLPARQALKAALGGDRLASRAELEKLALYCRGRSKVELEDVAAATGDAASASVDAAVDAVLAGRAGEFDAALGRLLASGSAPFLLLAAAMRQFQALALMRGRMERERLSAGAALASARPPVFFARKAVVEGALQSWTADGCARVLERLQAAVLETRRRPDLAKAVTRQSLLATALEAARTRR